RLIARNRNMSLRGVLGLAVTWIILAVSGLHVGQGESVASASAGQAALDQIRTIAAGASDQQRFDAAAAVDRFRHAAGGKLLTGLRGKDVLLVFVESYGRVAIEGLPSSPRLRAVLDTGTRRLRTSGYSSRSAFLTSPTFGGLSWLAHATLQSGLWVDNERLHDRLLSGRRMTLSSAFNRAGWRTLAMMASNDAGWPQGKAFYQFDDIYNRWDIAYRGPSFGWSAVPDQYVLSTFHQRVLGKPGRAPVMVEIDLSSSHPPWAPVPRLVDWSRLGHGSVYDGMQSRSRSARQLWRHPAKVEAAYVKSIAYSLESLISFVQKYGDDDLVLVMLGDHAPATIVSGHGASHDVPITVVARDPSVIDRIAGWGWQTGMRPDHQAPLWRMDAFRDRFLAAFSPELRPTPGPPAAPSEP
ncbi:MAG: CDP-alcohol phosphatidyltransferase family protein, partial [Nocardioidaceae bacterium]